MPGNWKTRSDEEVPAHVERIAEELQITPLIAGILWSRGYRTREEMDGFLSPGLRNLSQPSSIPGLSEAAAVLARGLEQGRRMAVWGDYDVDGVTSTALVKSFLAGRGFDVVHHLPNRMEEGYGLSVPGLEGLAANGVKLLLTVDCGISDHEAIGRANELGMTVVVSDHHLPGDELPPAAAICNPRLEDCECADLAGVGVAFMLMGALNRLLPGNPVDMKEYLDLVALGTVADVVRLTGQNRILVKNGLLLIKEARRPGVAVLKEVSGYDRFAALGAGQIGFGLAPRINAAGRLGDPEMALDLLLAPDVETAKPLAAKLNEFNVQRRSEEQDIFDQALEQAEEQIRLHNRAGLVLYAPHWHQGIIGIVASRIVEKFYRPALILCEDGDRLKGSGRSIGEFDLHEGLLSISDILLTFGGHKQAAGLSIEPGKLELLRQRFHEAVVGQVGEEPLKPTVRFDRALGFGEIGFELLKELELLQPFGMGNPEPLFTSPPVTVKDFRTFGKGNIHVKLVLSDKEAGVTLQAKAWRQGEIMSGHDFGGRKVSFAYTPKIDRFNGVPRIELLIRDWNFK